MPVDAKPGKCINFNAEFNTKNLKANFQISNLDNILSNELYTTLDRRSLCD